MSTWRPKETRSPTVAEGGCAPSRRLSIAERAVSGRSRTGPLFSAGPAVGVPVPGVTTDIMPHTAVVAGVSAGRSGGGMLLSMLIGTLQQHSRVEFLSSDCIDRTCVRSWTDGPRARAGSTERHLRHGAAASRPHQGHAGRRAQTPDCDPPRPG